jgi:inner membrane protein
MDSLTHIAIGACLGEAFAGRRGGKRAMIWGALAQSIPDIDFIASFWLETSDNLLAHRGFTHSILFCVLISPLLAYLVNRYDKHPGLPYKKWLYFFLATIGMHIFLDAFNNYGVGWFEPFDNTRLSYNALYVVDVFFSVVPAIVTVMLIVLPHRNKRRSFLWKTALICPMVYLFYCIGNKMYIDRQVQRFLAEKKISTNRVLTTPAPLQNWLWFVVAGNDSGYYTGYISVFDRKRDINFTYSPINRHLLVDLEERHEVKNLIRFSQRYYTVEQHDDTILFNDLRFGKITGWYDPTQRFAFSYYLRPEKMDNTLVVQRGRFANWNKVTFRSFLRKIRGN